METNTVLVLANPSEPQLAMLERLPDNTTIAVGNTIQAFSRTAGDATVIFNWSQSGALLQEVFRHTGRVRWVHSRAAGMDSQLFHELIESDVPVTNGSGVFSQSLGEFVLGAILFFAKDLRRMVRSQQAGQWDQFDIVEIAGQTVGIVGYGDIGRACAKRLEPMGMKVLALRRSPGPGEYRPSQLNEMLAACDYVVVAAPLTPETRAMIAEPQLRAMKKDAVLINVGRGPVVHEPSIVKALQERWIKGAALDVFDVEPLPADHPFYKLDNLLLSPHCADHTPDWLEQAMNFFLQQFERFEKGEPLLNVVDKRAGY